MKCLLLLLCALTLSNSQDAKPVILKDIEGPRIINGVEAGLGQFPWQAALFFQQELGSRFWFCSGAIISEKWILTAGHCVNTAESVLIYTGIIDISLEIQPSAISTEFILHKDFVADSLANDIALIKLPKSLTLDEYTTTISLSSDEIKAGTAITVSGWGRTNVSSSAISNLLHYINLTTISNEQCQDAYGTTRLILPEMVCAALNIDPVQAPCHGDSGGPVVVDFGTNPRHVAIASFVSDAGCDSSYPSEYTRTAAYRDWIKEKTGI
jgi:secreted trypsin-like serine protease